MRELESYKYDVFLSWTGADREIKNQIKKELELQNLTCFDSDIECKSRCYEECINAVGQSKVYLLILSDNILNDPTKTGRGRFTFVRQECDKAYEEESLGNLNIVVLNLSSSFRDNSSFYDYTDTIPFFFHTKILGYTRINAILQDGLLKDGDLKSIKNDARSFVEKRNLGTPVPSQKPRIDIAEHKVTENGIFSGREKELEEIYDSFAQGSQVVVLSGMGGIGKTHLARRFARRCKEEQLLVCPQMIFLKDIEDNGVDQLRTLVSAIDYKDKIYAEIVNLCEEDRFRRKLKAVEDLPEHTLLIVDNFNNLKEGGLNQIIEKLNCRLLITTRVNVSDFEVGGNIKQIKVDKLDIDSAYLMFTENSKSQVEPDLFKRAYELVDGHTITLCLMAKTILKHKLSLQSLLEKMSSTDNLSQKVDFTHNDDGKTDTIMGHLQSLYTVSNFDDGCKKVLCNMALLADGKIPTRDILEILELDTRNEVNELIANGWLEEFSFDGVDTLYLHPVLSSLINNLLKPSEENCQPIINYLVNSLSKNDGLSFANAQSAKDKLFFALLRLATNTGKLNGFLWNAFIDYSHQINNIQTIESKCNALAKILNETDAKRTISFVQTIIVESQPNNVEIATAYLNNLKDIATYYKETTKYLTVNINFIYCIPSLIGLLKDTLTIALKSAIENEDDVAFEQLTELILLVTHDRKTKGIITKHIKLRKKQGNYNGFIIYAEYSLLNALRNPKLNAGNFLKYNRNYIYNGMGKKISPSKMIFSNIPATLKSLFFCYKLENIIEKGNCDEMTVLLSNVLDLFSNIVYEQTFNPFEYLSILDKINSLRVKNGTSYISLDSLLENSMFLFQTYLSKDQREIKEHVKIPNFDLNNISIGDIPYLRLAVLINLKIEDKIAIEQAELLLEVQQKLYDEEHYKVLNAKFLLAEIYTTFKDYEKAVKLYAEIYKVIKNLWTKEEVLSVCKNMLYFPQQLSNYPLSFIKEVCEFVIDCEKENVDNTASFRKRYLDTLSFIPFKLKLSEEERKKAIELFNSVSNDSVEWLSNLKLKNFSEEELTNLLSLLYNGSFSAYFLAQFSTGDNLLNGLLLLKNKLPKKLYNLLDLLHSNGLATKARYKKEEDKLFGICSKTVEIGILIERDLFYVTSQSMREIIKLACKKCENTNDLNVFWDTIFPIDNDKKTEFIADCEQKITSCFNFDFSNLETPMSTEKIPKLKMQIFVNEVSRSMNNNYNYFNVSLITENQLRYVKDYTDYAQVSILKSVFEFIDKYKGSTLSPKRR